MNQQILSFYKGVRVSIRYYKSIDCEAQIYRFRGANAQSRRSWQALIWAFANLRRAYCIVRFHAIQSKLHHRPYKSLARVVEARNAVSCFNTSFEKGSSIFPLDSADFKRSSRSATILSIDTASCRFSATMYRSELAGRLVCKAQGPV